MEDPEHIDSQIPKELQTYFKHEDKMRRQIEEDDRAIYNLKPVYVMSPEIFKFNHWDGPFIA